MDKNNYQEGNKLVSKTFCGRVDVFEIVDEFPLGYEVWPIGRRNFPFPGYLPLGRFENYHMVEGSQLKAIKTDEALADEILNHSVKYGTVDCWKFKELASAC